MATERKRNGGAPAEVQAVWDTRQDIQRAIAQHSDDVRVLAHEFRGLIECTGLNPEAVLNPETPPSEKIRGFSEQIAGVLPAFAQKRTRNLEIELQKEMGKQRRNGLETQLAELKDYAGKLAVLAQVSLRGKSTPLLPVSVRNALPRFETVREATTRVVKTRLLEAMRSEQGPEALRKYLVEVIVPQVQSPLLGAGCLTKEEWQGLVTWASGEYKRATNGRPNIAPSDGSSATIGERTAAKMAPQPPKAEEVPSTDTAAQAKAADGDGANDAEECREAKAEREAERKNQPPKNGGKKGRKAMTAATEAK
ncbi:MAG: hypothetical protein WC618_03630 [Patescibacteria group bacterium]